MIDKPKIALITLRNAYPYGGVWRSLQLVYDFCQPYFDPTVCTLTFEQPYAMSLRKGKLHSSICYNGRYHGLPSIDVGARWAFWEPWHYKATQDAWREILSSFRYIFVVSGTVIAAYPPVLLDKSFVLWASTRYEEDRQQRVAGLSGIRWVIDRLAQPSMRAIEQTIIDKALLIFALSSYSFEEFSSIVPEAPEKMLLTGFPLAAQEELILNYYKKNTLQACIDVRLRERIILAVGRFSDPRKNIQMLLRFFKELYTLDPTVRLVVVGAAPEPSAYEQYQQEQFFQALSFTGPLSSQALSDWYCRAFLLVITSYQEGFCIAGLEALSHGVPVISTRCGGVVDYVHHEKTGFLVEQNDHRQMALYAQKIMNDQHLYNFFVTQSFSLIKKQFSHESIYTIFKRGLVRVYPELEDYFQAKDFNRAEALSVSVSSRATESL